MEESRSDTTNPEYIREKKYMNGFDKARILVGAVLFLFLFGYFRNIILDVPINSKFAVSFTVLFIIWRATSDNLFTFFTSGPTFNVGDDKGEVIVPSTGSCP